MRAATSVRHDGRAGRSPESGQVTVLFVLIFITMVLFAIVAVTVGQVLVRRQQAQMVVDAAALAGAGAQARGLNTIARWNEKSLHLLQGIQESTALPYMDNDTTTDERFVAELFTGGIAVPLVSDWAGDVLKNYQSIFDVFNGVINATNIAFSPYAFPRDEAKKVVEANFKDSGTIFKSEDLDGHGVLISPDELGNVTKLVKLTDPEEYKIAPYTYIFYAGNWALDTCAYIPPADAPCAILLAAYGTLNGYQTTIDPLVDPIKYKLGRFYDNDEGDDVRFAYYLKVSQSPVLFGKQYFDDIPPIIVAAAAKPYDGYLGDKFEPLFDASVIIGPYGQQSGKDISYTYKPKLVPLKNGEKLALPILAGGGFEDPGRWLTMLH